MAAKSNKLLPCFIYALFFLLFLLVSISPASSQTEETGQCVDGKYRHENRDCCKCGIGLQVVKHCINHLQYGKCEPCESGKYSSHPSNDKSCELCTSCSHPNENLAVSEPCTQSSDAKCGCQKDHYCSSGTDKDCKLCQTCHKCGAEGVKVPCVGTNNTVCNEKNEDGISAGGKAGIVIGVLALIALVAAAVFFWKKTKREDISINGNDEEGQPLGGKKEIPNVDLQPLMPDIAKAIGWKDMQELAMRIKIANTTIDCCKLDHPNDSEEATLQLLRKWVEKQGKEAPGKLIELLEKSEKNATADAVLNILRKAG
uniref:tumor necrosis factor receptor superfamily member 6 n=1 Tax=Semicossyphus pulcher TaxID=241346 RepID=UPI0037E802B2